MLRSDLSDMLSRFLLLFLPVGNSALLFSRVKVCTRDSIPDRGAAFGTIVSIIRA